MRVITPYDSLAPKSAMSTTSPARRPPVDVSSVRHVGLFHPTFLQFSLSLAHLLNKKCIYIGIKHHLFVYTQQTLTHRQRDVNKHQFPETFVQTLGK